MVKQLAVGLGVSCVLLLSNRPWLRAQQDPSTFRVNVVMVQLSVAVTDKDGHYISGLKPDDFIVTEDSITEKITNFEEGIVVPHSVADAAAGGKLKTAAGKEEPVTIQPLSPNQPGNSSVYILFDTSDYMYRGFVFAQDAIADFVRSLDGISKVALYSYSRNLSRVVPLTEDRAAVLRGVRNTVAGDDEAMYNSLLLTVKDAAHLQGRKAIVVFSNGPDNASMVPPEDVAELAQSTGTIIYMISTRAAQQDPASTAVFERMSKATGGKAYFSKSWHDEKQAFDSIREDLGHLYALSYYPQPNPNRGWRNIKVQLARKEMQKYRIRTREGYRLLQEGQISTGAAIPPPAGAAVKTMH